MVEIPRPDSKAATEMERQMQIYSIINYIIKKNNTRWKQWLHAGPKETGLRKKYTVHNILYNERIKKIDSFYLFIYFSNLYFQT